MNSLSVILNPDKAWEGLKEEDIIHLRDAQIQLVVIPAGLTSGRPSVAIRLDLPDGKTVVAETTARLVVGAGRMIMGRYPDLFEDAVAGAH